MNTLIGMLAPNMNTKEVLGNQFKTGETNSKDNFAKTMDKTQSSVERPKNEDQTLSQSKVNKTNQTYKRADSVVKEKLENQKEQVDVNENVAVLMMNLLESQLNLTTDELTKLLEEQGITVMDLTDQDTFRTFVMDALGEDEMSLLSGEVDLKALSKLFEDIKTIQSTYYTENKVITEETMVSQGEVIQNTQVIVEANPRQEEKILSNGVTPEILEATQAVDKISDKEEYLAVAKIDVKVTGEVEELLNVSEVSMTLPIQELSKQPGIEFWQNDLSTLTTETKASIEMPIHSQVLEKIYYSKLESLKELEMQLAPKELGKLTFKMIEQNGVVTAHIKVEQDKTKDLILEHLMELQEGLESQGLVIQDVQVEVKKDTHHSQMEMEKQKSAKRIQELIAKQMDEILAENQIDSVASKSLTSLELDYEV
ncbi:flagellar hook-length control protein FliK [Niameybacter massiliensis]|uniref:flagellar hook-length control protein FliK n=1 Tax=Niameybacter massiliensis TaxID=1658108 RepID=UPI0006B51569|nr:flagellar hook-length control protein FliK [Niameybacter massiliensis]